MRNIAVVIYARPETGDSTYSFSALDGDNSAPVSTTMPNVNNVYQFVSASLNYSIQSSSTTSTLILSMSTAPTVANILRSGQPIQIRDNGAIIFEGILLSLNYRMEPSRGSGQGGVYAIITLAPSIYQLTLLPVIYSTDQLAQISSLLKINITDLPVSGVAQPVTAENLVDYMVSNTDLLKYFLKNITYTGLPAEISLMATAGQSRDSVLRSSIDFTNTVFYQQEYGQLFIRQLDARIKAPFSLDLTNKAPVPNRGTTPSAGIPAISMLEYTYSENAASTPAVVSNYSMIPNNLGFAGMIASNFLSYTPNPKYYPRIQQLQATGWFSGQLGNTQINTNLVSDPTIANLSSGYQAYPDQYMISSKQFGAKQDSYTAYQALLTGKQMGQALVGYSNLECLISLDDPTLPKVGMEEILGKCVDILNCEMSAGLIATYNRSYSNAGSYLSLNIVPLGSITGYWVS